MLALAVLIGTAVRAHAADCGLRLLADVRLRDTDGYLSIVTSLGGPETSMLIDTGSDAGLLSPDVTEGRFERGLLARISGTGGGAHEVPVATVPTLRIGGLSLDDVPFPVGELPSFPRILPPIEGLIGADLLSHFEVEIDVSSGVFRLYEGHDLSSLCRDLPPWQGRLESVALTRVGNRMTLPVSLNRRVFTALLDSGARSRIVSRRVAVSAGVDADALDGEPGGITSGVDGRRQIYHWHRFASFGVGDDIERRPVLTVTGLADDREVLLGADWFARHRVWISYATSQLFFQSVAQR